MTALTCKRCLTPFVTLVDNPVELDAWRCTCTPPQELSTYVEYVDHPPTPLGAGAAGEVARLGEDAATSPALWDAIDRGAAKGAALLLVFLVVSGGFAALVLRDLIGGAA